MNAILIGEVGATGSDWVLVEGGCSRNFSLGGYNPVSQTEETLASLIRGLKGEIARSPVDVHYYGAGIGITPKTEEIRKQLSDNLNVGMVHLHSDLLGAARALCGRSAGVVCILGTGSNACFYDGAQLTTGHSLGYPLGDEGSGMDIGRRLVKAFYYGLLPSSLHTYFLKILPSSRIEFLTKFRAEPAPNRYLGSLIFSLQEVRNEDYIQQLLQLAFTDFINCHLHQVKRYSKINCAGSIAYYFCSEFEKCLEKFELSLGKVIRKPIDDLVLFHTEM